VIADIVDESVIVDVVKEAGRGGRGCIKVGILAKSCGLT